MSITKECMIVNMQIGLWQGYRLDKEASRVVTESNNASADAARVNKHLVPKEALKDIVSAQGAIRSHFYECTLPWKDNGDRLLTRKMYLPFIEDHERLVKEFERAVTNFLDHGYPKAIQQAEFRMGDLFKAEDYPSASLLRHRFYVNMDIDAVTEAGDFRVQIETSQLDRIRVGMEDAMNARLGRAMQEVWERLATTLGHFANKMGSDDVFRDSTVRNLEEIVDLLPGLNILDDPDLERIRQNIKGTLVGYTPKELRKDKDVRSVAAEEAAKIMDDMRGFMNAFGVKEGDK